MIFYGTSRPANGPAPGMSGITLAGRFPVDVAERRESAFGYKQTFSGPNLRSALPPGADIPRPTLDFRC